LDAAAARHGKFRTLVQVTSGNFLEMFDFFLFGVYASTIAKAFFPNESQFVSPKRTFLSFAMRPVGALVLGG
jgi:MFS transporter, MHS family, citrate/tricarballylate:H+ symporter